MFQESVNNDSNLCISTSLGSHNVHLWLRNGQASSEANDDTDDNEALHPGEVGDKWYEMFSLRDDKSHWNYLIYKVVNGFGSDYTLVHFVFHFNSI